MGLQNMNQRERVKAIFHYQPYDRMPVVHFGYWYETLQKWMMEGHISQEEAVGWGDGNDADRSIAEKLGFDFNWFTVASPWTGLKPGFEARVLEELPDGFKKVLNGFGGVELHREGAGSIPAEIDHLLKGRDSWEEHFKHRLQYSEDRINEDWMQQLQAENDSRQEPLGLHCGSLFGDIRNWLGVEGLSYLYVDDEDLYDEIIHTVGELCYRLTEKMLSFGVAFDFAHFWEDICFKNGPLVNPSIFREKVGPQYKRICDLLRRHGITIVSLDCDGLIDSLLPVWLENGVNTMFPIEVGTWHASIAPWREKYGQQLRGVGGMNKHVFAADYKAVDAEIERLKPLIKLGGFIPCPDHRIAPDAKWENVQYYCDRMHRLF